jgi:hypothetical protein
MQRKFDKHDFKDARDLLRIQDRKEFLRTLKLYDPEIEKYPERLEKAISIWLEYQADMKNRFPF